MSFSRERGEDSKNVEFEAESLKNPEVHEDEEVEVYLNGVPVDNLKKIISEVSSKNPVKLERVDEIT